MRSLPLVRMCLALDKGEEKEDEHMTNVPGWIPTHSKVMCYVPSIEPTKTPPH